MSTGKPTHHQQKGEHKVKNVPEHWVGLGFVVILVVLFGIAGEMEHRDLQHIEQQKEQRQ